MRGQFAERLKHAALPPQFRERDVNFFPGEQLDSLRRVVRKRPVIKHQRDVTGVRVRGEK